MKQYKVLRPFCHNGRVRQEGEILSMHERQARYLIMGPEPWVAPIAEGASTELKAEPAEPKAGAEESRGRKAKKSDEPKPVPAGFEQGAEKGVENA